MALIPLRFLLSDAHGDALAPTGLLDRAVEDPLMEERFARIKAQLTAALALRATLRDLGVTPPDTIDLVPLVRAAKPLLTFKQANILLVLNREANEAKHLIAFRSRV